MDAGDWAVIAESMPSRVFETSNTVKPYQSSVQGRVPIHPEFFIMERLNQHAEAKR
jgi:hypothetical protein